jgi:Predicted transcriptional regulator
MSLRFPSEIVVERFLPTVRATLATELDERGLTQEEIAARLGVSQAAVSQYVRGDVTVEERFVDDERCGRPSSGSPTGSRRVRWTATRPSGSCSR